MPTESDDLLDYEAVAQTQPTTTDPVTVDVNRQQTVRGQLEDLIATDSQYMTQAREGALRTAQSRGLLNSSIAAGAGEEAAIGAAAPIAAQDAATFARRAEFNASSQNQFGIQAAGHQQTMERATQAEGAQSRLMAQEAEQERARAEQGFGHASQLSAQDAAQALTQSRETFGQNLTMLQQELANSQVLMGLEQTNALERLNADHENTLARLEAAAALDQQGAASEFSRTLQLDYVNQAAALQRMLMDSITQINTTEGLTANQQRQAIETVTQRFTTDLAMLQGFYAASPNWDPTWQMPGATATAPAGPATPGDVQDAVESGGVTGAPSGGVGGTGGGGVPGGSVPVGSGAGAGSFTGNSPTSPVDVGFDSADALIGGVVAGPVGAIVAGVAGGSSAAAPAQPAGVPTTSNSPASAPTDPAVPTTNNSGVGNAPNAGAINANFDLLNDIYDSAMNLDSARYGVMQQSSAQLPGRRASEQ